jgi:selenocysteine lyase/cysteine desulfurase
MTCSLLRRLTETGSIHLDNKTPDLPLISLNVNGMDPDRVGFILARIYGIVSRTGLHCAPLVHQRINGGRGSVRLSLSCMNTPGECELVADALSEVATSAG